MAASKQKLGCTILTLRSENVMVPNAAIAEIISAKDTVKIDDAPTWYLGKMPWHDEELPIISYEAAGGGEARPVNLNTQVAVLYSVNQGSDYPYIGLVISGVPHVSVLNRNQIITDPDFLQNQNPHPMVAQKTRINGAAVSILDLDEIENMIASAESQDSMSE